MRERPILFSGEMVKALLSGHKTQTRRTNGLEDMSDKPHWHYAGMSRNDDVLKAQFDNGKMIHGVKCPYGMEGHHLWVRETFKVNPFNQFVYRANKPISRAAKVDHAFGPWKPSIFMPRKASRLTLEITEVRVERLQDITEEDAEKEGIKYPAGGPTSCYRMGFSWLWESINGKNSWDKNPFVWVISFTRIHP
jgi:hypothetical protein